MDIELDNGGGGGGNNNAAAVVSSSPNPADPLAEERQPFTWLRAAPYIAGVLAGVALFAAGVALMGSRRRSCSAAAAAGADDENKPPCSNTTGGYDDELLWFVLAFVGAALLVFAMYKAATELVCCAPRLDQADD